MRKEFVAAFLDLALRDEKIVFLSGDLGYLALENLRDKLGERFINAGVAEQNMISVAAGLAARGFKPWAYSIAPFITLRPYEQLRNDVCAHNLDVKIVGNGGGFGYGIMGATHHTLEDVGCLQLLPHMRVRVPCLATDVGRLIEKSDRETGPTYLRLGMGLPGEALQSEGAWHWHARGEHGIAIASGPVVKGLLETLKDFDIVTVDEFPLPEIPEALARKIESTGILLSAEEHLPHGGLGQALATRLLGKLAKPIRFLPISAPGYPSGRYGSQRWHWEECGLAGPLLAKRVDTFLEESRG